MTTYVTKVSTGRDGSRPTIRGQGSLTGQVYTCPVASTDEKTWVYTRFEVLSFALRDAYGVTQREADYASVVALVVLANEASWGANEWNWNAFGIGCAGAAQCVRFGPGQGDPELRAYADLAEGVRDFWRLLNRNATAAEWALFLAGDLWAWRGLWHRDAWSWHSGAAAANSIFARVVSDLTVQGVDPSRLPPAHPLAAGDTFGDASSTGGGAPGGVSGTGAGGAAPRKGGLGVLLLLGLGLVVAGSGGSSKGR